MGNHARIVVIGSLVFDFVARADRLPRKGETVLGEAFGMFPGGKGANQAVQAARLGADVFLVGCVGQDFLGGRLIASLRDSGVHTDFVRRDASATTAACCIHVDREGHNTIVIVPEANDTCSPDDVDAAAAVIRSADMVVCQLEIPLPTVAHAAEIAAAHRIRFLLNPAPARHLPDSLLARITLITPNEIEAETLTGLQASVPGDTAQAGWEEAAAKELLRRGVGTVVITLGEKGAYAATAILEQRIPGYRVTVVDATAAGDAFSGALAVALAERWELPEALGFANAAGALATTRPGAQPSLATRQEVEQLINRTQDGP
jgi:ribokinase